MENGLEKASSSFNKLPDVLGDKHRELVAHALGLVDNYELPAWNSDNLYPLLGEDIHLTAAR